MVTKSNNQHKCSRGGSDYMATFHRIKKEIGNKVLVKFNHMCQKCQSKIDLVVHHVKRVNFNDPLYQEPTNMIVLCRSCHMSHHRINGEIPNRPVSKFGKGITFNPRGRKFKLHLNNKHRGYFQTYEEALSEKNKILGI